MTPTTDDEEKYREDVEIRRAQEFWVFIFNLSGAIVAGIIVAVLVILFTR